MQKIATTHAASDTNLAALASPLDTPSKLPIQKQVQQEPHPGQLAMPMQKIRTS